MKQSSARANPIFDLRTAAGEPPLGRDGGYFRDDQGEMFLHWQESYRTASTKIGVLELQTGKWLTQPPSFHIAAKQYDSRDLALRAGIAAMIRRARKYMRNKDGEGTQWNEGYAGRVIEWALSLKPETVPETPEEITPDANPNSALGVKTATEEIIDPVVRMLCEAKRARTAYPAGHTFAMTNPIVNGQMVTMGTCACGDTFSYKWGSYQRMDAAIEAHWQKFDHLPEKVDGRGQPIEAKPESADTADKRSRRRGKSAKEQLANGKQPTFDSAEPSPALALASGDLATPDASATSSAATPLRNVDDALASRHEPASETPAPTDAGSPVSGTVRLPKSDDPEFLEWKALSAIDSGIGVTGPAVEGLIKRGLVVDDYVDGTLELTEDDGRARLRELDAKYLPQPVAEYGPSPDAAADDKCARCMPAQICAGSPRSVDDLGSVQDALKMSSDGPSSSGSVTADQAVNIPASDDTDDLVLDWPSYDSFLEDKIVTAPLRGIEVPRDALHPYLKPHCKDLVVWALRLGCSAIFASFGLHKTAMQLEWCRQLVKHTGQSSLTVVPLGVRHGFLDEAQSLGMDVRFIRTSEEFDELYCEGGRHFLTNYESIREGKLDPSLFEACSLDEASVLRSYGSKTFQEFLPLFKDVPFKLVATATPSPNRYKELIHYSGFLGVMDTGLALTRFFQRNSEKAGDLTLYPHKEDEFWMWVHSWAAFLQKPSELGYSDEGYELPPLKLTWHEVPADHSKAEAERDGQGVMFRNVAVSLKDAAASRRDSLPARIAKMMELIAQDPSSHYLIWHDLEAEREAIEKALPEVVTITGSGMDIDTREARLHDFEEGRTKYFATKPVLSGSGSNFQYHCHKAIYVAMPGYGYKFNDFIQSLYRLQRFGQAFPVEVDIIYCEDERAGRAALEEKWALDTEMRRRMSEIIRQHGLNTLPLRDALLRTIGVQRLEIKGKNFTAINNDCVAETRTWPENAVDLMVTSIPFSNHYEYSPSYRDFGHTDDNGHFWSQMDFLTAELFRILKPGRLACIHVKDRVLFGSVTGEGVPTISPFHAEAIMHYRAHGFQYMGMITVVTDVVRENNQTYRLGWSENAKDSTKMGVGSPEYILLMRKPQSNRQKSYADVPVTKQKPSTVPLAIDVSSEGTEIRANVLSDETDGYSRARWQIDAHAFWRSSGNRHLTPEEFAMLDSAEHAKLFSRISADRVYDFEAHVRIGEALERKGTLPATFMAIAPGSHHPDVWHDVNRMRTLNMMQQRKGQEMHLCPLQFDIVDRLIERYSNPGELVLDPFGGLMTTPYRAILKKRRGVGIELSATYFVDGVHYLRAAEDEMATPELFDLAQFDAANTPPQDLMESEA